jgi:hypothetical protein
MVMAAAVVGLMGGGCAAPSAGEKVAESYTKTRGHLASAQDQIDQTLSTMNSLRITNATNLSNAFSQYKSAVTGLEKKGAEAKQIATAMQENVDMNMQRWQKEMDSINDPTVKASVQSRRDAVSSNYDQLKMYAQDARKAYDPFVKKNQDIVKALSVNLSPGSVQSLATAMDQTVADGNALKQKIGAMQRAMDNMAKGQAPIGSAAGK